MIFQANWSYSDPAEVDYYFATISINGGQVEYTEPSLPANASSISIDYNAQAGDELTAVITAHRIGGGERQASASIVY